MRPKHKTYAMCLHGEAHIVAKFGLIRKIKVYMESEQNGPVWGHNVTQAHNLACMHIMFQNAESHILAKLCQISEIKVSMEYQDYSHVSGHILGPLKGPEALRGGQQPLIGAKGTQTALRLFHFVSMETKFLGSTWAKHYCWHQTWRTINFHRELICQESNQSELQVFAILT